MEEIATLSNGNVKMERGNVKMEEPYFDDEDMGPVEDQPSKDFLDLFDKLDRSISGELVEKAWKQYDTIAQQIILEGDQCTWMACSFYTTVWQSTPIGAEPIYRYSVSRLLKICNMSVLAFFDKLNKWADMIIASRRLNDHINRVQSNLAVSTVVFKKYLPIFRLVFANVPPAENPFPGGIEAEELGDFFVNLSTRAIFELVWVAFLAFKKQFVTVNEDLMTSFHLLICIVDLVFEQLCSANLNEFLNSGFLSRLDSSGQMALELLCDAFAGDTLDAKHLRSHWLMPKLQNFFEQDLVRGMDEPGGFVTNFEFNKRTFGTIYEDKLMKKGEIDERIFLEGVLNTMDVVFDQFSDATVISTLRSSDHQPAGSTVDADLLLRMSTQSCLEKLHGQRQLQTPLTGKSYVITPEQYCPSSPLSQSTQRAQKLADLLSVDFRVSNDLDFLLSDYQSNAKGLIAEKVSIYGRRLVEKVAEEKASGSAEFDETFTAMLTKRKEDVEILFFRLLERILVFDRDKVLNMGIEVPANVATILLKTDFLGSLYICALEIVLTTCGSERRFPWSSHLVGLAPLGFYKTIELVIRAEAALSRDVVKHLNKIEELVLEELAWAVDSPLWPLLASFEGDTIPSVCSFVQNQTEQTPDNLPSSLTLFFRKVYYLATVRLQDLCERLRLDQSGRNRVWTLFEHVFRSQTSLMLGRHLDQILLCCVYTVVKVCAYDITFHDVIYHYRHQPQAESRVYRRVFVESDATAGSKTDAAISADESKFQSESGIPYSAPNTPNPAQQSTEVDLITFYNRVFIARVEEFARHLGSAESVAENLVSIVRMPRDLVQQQQMPTSPRRMITNQINVVSLGQKPPASSTHHTARSMRYDFSRTPAKDLKNINAMIRQQSGIGAGGGSMAF